MLRSCADLFQADRDLAATSYCGTGNFSYRKPIISSITACQMLLKADSLSQSIILCRQMLWSCADLLQADRDLAATSYCGTGNFSHRKPVLSSITAWQLLLLEFDTYDDEINITCVSKHYFALIRKLCTVWETLLLRLILNKQDIHKYHFFGLLSSFSVSSFKHLTTTIV